MTTVLRTFPREHSAISPSSFARIEKCTMSHKLTAGRGPTVSSDAALRGTAAHALFEWGLRHKGELDPIESVAVEGRTVRVDDRMRVACASAVDWVRTHLHGRPLLIEH
jgi:hypothetical protein